MVAIAVPVIVAVIAAMVVTVIALMIVAVAAVEPAVMVVEAVPSTNKAHAYIIPPPGDPISAVIVACRPDDISGAGARRNVGRSAHINPELSCLGCSRSKAQPASHYCRTQHPFTQVFHKSSVPSDNYRFG